MKKRALITGITGMAGSHLADLLLSKDYEVFGLVRRTSKLNLTNIKHIENQVTLLAGDLTDQNSIYRAIYESDPHEIYNLGAQSFVKESWASPISTSDITGLGCLRVLEAIREYKKPIKFYQASSSEQFGKMQTTSANELTEFYPRSPYGAAKVFAHHMTVNYRESYNMFNCCGILFNHESSRRGIEFVTRKITNGVAKIYFGLTDYLELGNLDAIRDWGYAKYYVEAMWLMLQQNDPGDYVIATGQTHTIRDFLDLAFTSVGYNDWTKYVKISEQYKRPADVDYLCGDSTKAREVLGWKPKHSLQQIVSEMVENDINLLRDDNVTKR